MSQEHILECPPISAHVYEATPGWDVVVRLLELTKTHYAIMDLNAAKNTALAYARQLCQENSVNVPACLEAPEWTQRYSSTHL